MVQDHKPIGSNTPSREPLQVTITVAAELLSYDQRTIRRLIERRELKAVGHGKLRRVLMSSIRDYQSRHLS